VWPYVLSAPLNDGRMGKENPGEGEKIHAVLFLRVEKRKKTRGCTAGMASYPLFSSAEMRKEGGGGKSEGGGKEQSLLWFMSERGETFRGEKEPAFFPSLFNVRIKKKEKRRGEGHAN